MQEEDEEKMEGQSVMDDNRGGENSKDAKGEKVEKEDEGQVENQSVQKNMSDMRGKHNNDERMEAQSTPKKRNAK